MTFNFSYANAAQGLLSSNNEKIEFRQRRFDYNYQVQPQIFTHFHDLLHLTGDFKYDRALWQLETGGQFLDIGELKTTNAGNNVGEIYFTDFYNPNDNWRIDYKYDQNGNISQMVNLNANLDTGEVFHYLHDAQNHEISVRRFEQNNSSTNFDSVVYDGNVVRKLYRGSNNGLYFYLTENIYQYTAGFISQNDITENSNGNTQTEREIYSNNGTRYTKMVKVKVENGLTGDTL
jgi:hypothetical protein